MTKFKKQVEAPAGSKYILQGNAAFALGVIHAGYHAADGYPGTPSTEVIDKSLAFVQDRIQVGWSVNEAVAVGVGIGRAIAGYDSVITMKIPGVFQAGDVISTSAFYTRQAGALVLYAATDYVPSSTQHVIDARYFFAAARLPVLEPRHHQEMYEIAWTAADLSKRFHTPVVVLASGILTHSEGLVTTRAARTVPPLEIPGNLKPWMLMPGIARDNYNRATRERIPGIREWAETSNLVEEIDGFAADEKGENWGVIVCGESTIILREALSAAGVNPPILTLSVPNPLPRERIKRFAAKIKGKLFVFEEGDRFMQEKLRLLGLEVIGKDELSTVTTWTPETVLEFLSRHVTLHYRDNKKAIDLEPLPRPPSICPGCPYRAFGLAVAKLKKRKKLFASFGDIGCSTLLYFINALDTVCCMGASDSLRQGFVMSRPEMAGMTVSVIGDSCECHSGLDATRNAVFRNVPGVKVILDNRITAMTGGQPAPSSELNLAHEPHRFNLRRAVAAEVEHTVAVDAYDLAAVEKALKEALDLAAEGEFSTLILEGSCIQEAENRDRVPVLTIDYDTCQGCGLCNICPGIEVGEDGKPRFTNLCTNCGGNTQICLQCCHRGAIIPQPEKNAAYSPNPDFPKPEALETVVPDKAKLPDSLRVAIRGIGGQGNLFFGKVLAEVAMRTPYAETHIVKGDTHGMAQLGGSVISTFSCGKVFSSTLAPGSTDVLVVMEVSEVLQPGFLDLMKPKGTIIINTFTALPVNAKKEDYPRLEDIEGMLTEYNVIKIDATQIAARLGDKAGRSANVVVLGLLSTVEPFNQIPEGIWLGALMALSPKDWLKSANGLAFASGRNYLDPPPIV